MRQSPVPGQAKPQAVLINFAPHRFPVAINPKTTVGTLRQFVTKKAQEKYPNVQDLDVNLFVPMTAEQKEGSKGACSSFGGICAGCFCCGCACSSCCQVKVGLCLEDDEATLSSCGVDPGDEIRLLSKAVAEHLADKKLPIRQVKEAYKSLAESKASSQQDEAIELEDGPPFDLMCPHSDLGELGAGWAMLFEFVLFLAGVSGILFLAQYALFQHYSSLATRPGPSIKWDPDGNHEDLTHAWPFLGSAAETGPAGTSSLIPAYCVLASCVLLLFLGAHYSYRQHYLRRAIDVREVDPNDFAIFVEGLPEDAKDEGPIKKFFEENAVPGSNTEVVKVVVGYDVNDFLGKRARMMELSDADKNDPERKELNKILMDMATLRQSLRTTGCCVVVLRYQEDLHECLKAWRPSRNWLARMCGGDLPQYKNEYSLKVTRAANPSDMLWENHGVDPSERMKAHAKIYLQMFGIFLLGTGFTAICASLARAHEGQRVLSTLESFALVAANLSGVLLLKKATADMKYETKTIRDTRVASLYSVLQVLNYCLILLLVLRDPAKNWYTEDGLLDDVVSLIIVNCWVYPVLFGLFDLYGRIPKCMNGAYMNDVKAAGSTGMTQVQFANFFNPHEIQAPKLMAMCIKTFFTGVFFSPIYPLGLAITVVSLVLFYFTFKFLLLRRSSRPYRLSHDMPQFMVRVTYAASAGLALSSAYLLRPSLTGDGAEALGQVSWFMTLASLVMFVLPHRMNQAFTGAVLWQYCLPALHDEDGEHDYYKAQLAFPKHGKYHIAHNVYLHMDLILSKGKPENREWDVQGNLLAPGQTWPSAAPKTDTTAPVAPAGGRLDAVPAPTPPPAPPIPSAASTLDASDHLDDEDRQGDEDEASALAGADPHALALEDLKYKVKVGDVGHDEDEESVVSAPDSEDPGDDVESPLVSKDPEAAATLEAGSMAKVTGLRGRAGRNRVSDKYNGTTCTLLSREARSCKWNVMLKDGVRTQLPQEKLTPHQTFRAGDEVSYPDETGVRITAEICVWDTDKGKWQVTTAFGTRFVRAHKLEL